MAADWTKLLERNRLYAQTKHRPQPYLNEFEAFNSPPPSVFIFSCIDFRASTEQLLDLKGDEAFVVRNLGGRIKNSLSSLLFAEHVTQGQVIKDIVIIHHTDCGLTHFTDKDFQDGLKAKYPQLAGEISQLEVGAYDGSDMNKHREAIREDLKFFKESQLVRPELKDRVYGYVYDIKSGKLIPVPYVAVPYDG
ncbi:carbonic anhydrase [Coniochaeta sp. PMI_546]|nr:carbonic anhydrase [Coniochaeta sp. PMI_546]